MFDRLTLIIIARFMTASLHLIRSLLSHQIQSVFIHYYRTLTRRLMFNMFDEFVRQRKMNVVDGYHYVHEVRNAHSTHCRVHVNCHDISYIDESLLASDLKLVKNKFECCECWTIVIKEIAESRDERLTYTHHIDLDVEQD